MNLQNLPRKILRHIAVTPVQRLRKWRHRSRRRALEAKLAQRVGLRVQTGPFMGMELVPATHGLGSKVLGTHELEVWPVIDAIANSGVEHFVNVGAAEGYYAVGLLRLHRDTRATAFELDTSHHAAMESLAVRNGVETRLTICGECDVTSLDSVIRPDERTVLLVDVEGAERELLDIDRVPALQHSAILVEVHDFIDRHLSRLLRLRFRDTHQLTVYRSRMRDVADLPSVPGFRSEMLLRAASEGRPATMEWFWLQPHTADWLAAT